MTHTFKGFYRLLLGGALSLTLLAGCGGGGGGGGGETNNGGTTEPQQSTTESFTLAVNKFGDGTVTSNTSEISCGNDCSKPYQAGTTVVLTATPNSGVQLHSWTGCDSALGDICTVTMNSNRTVFPTFKLTESKIPPTTKILSDATMQLLVRKEDNIYYFDPLAEEIANLQANDVIVSGYNSGLLRKVVSVFTSPEGLIAVETTEATIEDAIEKGTVAFTKSLTHGDIMSSKALAPGVNLAKAEARATDFYFNIDTVLDMDDDPNTTWDQVKATGNITINFEVDAAAAVDWSWTKLRPVIKEFKSVLITKENQRLSITADSSILSINKKKAIYEQYFAAIPVSGPLPLVVIPKVTVYLGVKGDISASVSTTVSTEQIFTAGIKYSEDYGWEEIKDYSHTFAFDPPSVSASAYIKGYISPEFKLFINDILGPYFNVEGYLKLETGASSPIWWKLYAGMSGSAGAKVEILSRWTLAEFGLKELFKIERELASSASITDAVNRPPIIFSLDASSLSVATSGSSVISCNATDPDNDTLTYSWSKTGGTISGTGTAVTWTAPSVAGSYLVTCSVSDTKGGTISKDLTITVSSTSIPGNISVTPSSGYWTSTPQNVSVSSSDAAKIYYTIRTTTDGTTPADPPEPSATLNDGYISSSSGTFQVYASAGQNKKLKVRFRGENNGVYGATSSVYSYSINLTTTTQYTLTVSKSGTGSGTVTATGINCGSDCSENYNSGTPVTLTAAASSGSTFAGWSGGGCSGTGSCTVTMDAAKTVTVAFNLSIVTPGAVSISPSTGNWTSSPQNVSVSSSDAAKIYYTIRTTTDGTTPADPPEPSATLNDGYISSSSGTFQVYASAGQNKKLKVRFRGENNGVYGATSSVYSYSINLTTTTQYTLTVSKSGTGSGTVTSSPAGISCGSDCTENYNSGTTITLSASALSGSTFTGWSGACSGTSTTCTVTMDAAKSVTATFNTQTNIAPNSPSVLSQYKTDGTAITAGGTTSETSIKLRGNVSDPNNDQVKLQVELRTTSQSFTGTVTHESSLVSSGGTAEITVSGLSNGNYQWRGRTVDASGLTSGWIDAGNSGADFIVSTNSSPNLPTSLSQFKSDQTTGIPLGGATTESTVVMKGGVSDPDGDTVQIEVEVRPTSQSFTGTPNCTSGVSQSSGGTAHATCYSLTDGNYHWKGRTKDSNGAVSNWQSAGGNADGQTDFIVATPITWEFNTNGNFEGWSPVNGSSSSVNSGALFIDPAGNDPYVQGPTISASAASYKNVSLRMASNAIDGNGYVYFKTQTENAYNDDKRVPFTVLYCSPSACNGQASWYNYTVYMGSHAKWTGAITGIRIDPADNGQSSTDKDTIGIDYIRLTP